MRDLITIMCILTVAGCTEKTTEPIDDFDPDFERRMLAGTFVLAEPVTLDPDYPEFGPVLVRSVLWFDLDASMVRESTYVAWIDRGDTTSMATGVKVARLFLEAPSRDSRGDIGQGVRLTSHSSDRPGSYGRGIVTERGIEMRFTEHRAFGTSADYGLRNGPSGPINALTRYIRQ